MSMVTVEERDESSVDQSNPQIAEAIYRLHRKGATYHLNQLLSKLRPGEVAKALDGFSEDTAAAVFSLITPPLHAALVLDEVQDSLRNHLLNHCRADLIVAALECLPSDARHRYLGALDESVSHRLMEAMRQESAKDLEDLRQYKQSTAGSLMSTHYFALPETTTAADAINAVQGLSSKDSVFYLYVVNEQKRLTGVCSLRKLLLTESEKPLKEIMSSHLVKVNVNTPQEEVARQITHYRLLAVPVVDNQGGLLGQITIDKLVDIIQDETTGSILKMVGIQSKKTDVLTQSPFHIFRTRVPWLITAFIGYLAISAVLDGFEETLSTVVQLAFFFPIVIGMSGNAGTQTGTVVVRGLALDLIRNSHFFKLLLKELGTNLIQGVVYGGCLGLAAYLVFQNLRLAMTVGPALMLNIIAASVIAMSLPFFFKRVGVDPAVAAGPLALTFIDFVGSTNYLVIAYLMFRH
jgi:magnesium transporter